VTIGALVVTLVGLLVLASRSPSGPGLLIEAADPPGGVDEVRVHVVGEVAAPGVVTMAPGERVVDAIAHAGGFTSMADEVVFDLAKPGQRSPRWERDAGHRNPPTGPVPVA